jgi:phosphatidylserine/phosphatidylglycerophosphate/cardiolipin synthase-like enzyme
MLGLFCYNSQNYVTTTETIVNHFLKTFFCHNRNMHKRLYLQMLFCFALLWQGCAKPPIGVHFTPGDSPTQAIVDALAQAKAAIHVQAYSFTSAPIADALRQAHRRGVAVSVILDKSNQTDRYSVATFLGNAGIDVWIDSRHAIAHNKVMIVDRSVVITGSFNFTRSAEERNAENLLVIRDTELARRYLANWERCKSHSEKMQ